ncbi:MAG: peptidylprolyl isomerase [Halofilum sp. (in: g-proteobacteria)]|nr:peptidylprolyl isomerase [Halofilum sp. (in: g-proteobacteria)]
MRHSLFTASVLAAGLALAGCQPGGNGGGEAAVAAPDPDKVVARINGKPIAEVALDAQIQAMSARGQPVERAQALQELITIELLAQEAEKQGLPEQPEIQAEIERRRASLLAQHLIRAELTSHEVTDEDLRARYEQEVAGSAATKEYKARHILLESEEKAQSLIGELDEGAEFQALAKEHSTGPSGPQGGDLGWFQTGDMVPPFGNAVEALEPGQHSSEPVKTQFGWHVILLEETRAAEPPAFEDVRAQLRNRMVSEHIQQFVADLRQQGEVEIVAEDLKPDAGADDSGGSGGDAGSGDAGDDAS